MLSTLLRKTIVVPVVPQCIIRAVSTYGSLDSPLVNHAFIDVALIQLLKNKKAKKSDVNEFIEHYKTRMNRQNFINMLHGCRRRHVLEPRHIFTAASGLKFADDEALSVAQLEQVFQSISFMSHRVGSVRVLLGVISEAVRDSEHELDIDQIATFMFSLLQMKSGVPEVREMITVLASKLSTCNQTINNDSASKLIGGFQGFSTKYSEVRSALDIVVKKLKENGEANTSLTEIQLSRALYGMKRFSSDIDSVRRLTAWILTKAETCSMNSEQVSQALYAVQSMDTDAVEVRALLEYLNQQVAQLEGETPLHDSDTFDILKSLETASYNADAVTKLISTIKSRTASR